MAKCRINLGDGVRDRVSGLTGIAVSRIEYLNGCRQFGIQAKAHEGGIPEIEYVDDIQLQLIASQTGIRFSDEPEEEGPGGPQRGPNAKANPKR